MIEQLPPPGLDGTYRGSCVVCLKGTDTAVGIEGIAEFVAATLNIMGLADDEAANTLSEATGCDPGMVPPGRFTVIIRLCRDCAGKGDRKFQVGPFPGNVPHYTQGFDVEDGQHR